MLRNLPFRLFILFALCGCVSNDADTLLSTNTEPLGVPKIDGKTPEIGQVPVGQTAQMSAAEKNALKQELGDSTQKADVQAANSEATDYRAEAAALRKLAEDERKKRLEQIESRKF